MDAWLLTWVGTSGAITPETEIVAILDSRRSEATIADLAELVFMRSQLTAHSMTHWANRKQGRWWGTQKALTGGILVGSNPFVYARQVKNLNVEMAEDESTETVRWREPPSYRQHPETHAIELVEEGQERCLVRSGRLPLSHDLG